MGMGAGIPGMGNIMNGIGSLDSNTQNAVMTSAIGAATEIAKDPNLRKAAIGAVKDGKIDTSLLAQADSGAINRIMKHGETAAGAVANDEGAIQSVADYTGASKESVKATGTAALAAANMAAENKEFQEFAKGKITDRVIDDSIERQRKGKF
jgi:hypothetical protein